MRRAFVMAVIGATVLGCSCGADGPWARLPDCVSTDSCLPLQDLPEDAAEYPDGGSVDVDSTCPSAIPSGPCPGTITCNYGQSTMCPGMSGPITTCYCNLGNWACMDVPYDCADVPRSDDASGDIPDPPGTPDVPGGCAAFEDCRPDQRCVEGVCVDGPAACGMPKPTDSSCRKTLVQDDCVAAGGIWACDPCPWIPVEQKRCECSCPTTDDECPCWLDSHCQGFCDFEFPSGLDVGVCKGLGKCSPRTFKSPSGCFCVFYESYPPGQQVSIQCIC